MLTKQWLLVTERPFAENVNLGYSIEVTMQFINAKTQLPIVVCTAEGQGSTEADDIRIAITRALEPLFKE